jgi:hypothetical protein
VVYASSVHAVGMHGPGIDTDAPHRPDTFYGLSKCFAEDLARLYWEKRGLEAVCLRIFSATEAPQNARSLGTWLSRGDLVRLVERAVDTPVTGFCVVYGISANDRCPCRTRGGVARLPPPGQRRGVSRPRSWHGQARIPRTPAQSRLGGPFATVPLGESGVAGIQPSPQRASPRRAAVAGSRANGGTAVQQDRSLQAALPELSDHGPRNPGLPLDLAGCGARPPTPRPSSGARGPSRRGAASRRSSRPLGSCAPSRSWTSRRSRATTRRGACGACAPRPASPSRGTSSTRWGWMPSPWAPSASTTTWCRPPSRPCGARPSRSQPCPRASRRACRPSTCASRRSTSRSPPARERSTSSSRAATCSRATGRPSTTRCARCARPAGTPTSRPSSPRASSARCATSLARRSSA